MLPQRVEAVGRRPHHAFQIKQFLVGPYLRAVAAGRKGQIPAQHHAAERGREAPPTGDEPETASKRTWRSPREFRIPFRARERTRFAPAQFVGPLLPRDEIEMIFERAEERVVIEPVAMARGKVRHGLSPVAMRHEMSERGLEQCDPRSANRQAIAKRTRDSACRTASTCGCSTPPSPSSPI